ncbi:MAG: hypothetical protein M1817_006771 [Caeruleum heppii]|nr:MAG: hypothetical protein M1817_006771 [Caeruleum heppii]
MAVLGFLDLSFDVKSLIISYVIRPTDMKSLCLTCSAIRDITVKQLYKKVELDVGGEADLKLSALLGRSNPGLEHIRSLILNPVNDAFPSPPPSPRLPSPPPPPPPQPPNPHPTFMAAIGGLPPPPPPVIHVTESTNRRRRRSEDSKGRWSPAHFTTRLLIELLPEHILEKVRWTTYDEFSVDNFLFLCKKQKKLDCIEVGPTDKSLAEALEKHPGLVTNLEQLHAVDLYPNSLDTLKACATVLKRTPRLAELWIENGFESRDDDGDSDAGDDEPKIDDLCSEPGLLTRTLFADKMPFQTCTSMTLKYLALGKMNLRWVAQTYMRIVNFSLLENLEIRSCRGADALFAEMVKPSKKPSNLKEFTFAHTELSQNFALSALENFLSAISSLKKIYINFAGAMTLPKIESICGHGERLRSLIVHSGGDQAPYHAIRARYSPSDVKKLCKECPKLRQLALAWPETSILHPDWDYGFKEYAAAVMTLSDLTTLNVISGPAPSSHLRNSRDELNLITYERQLVWIAEGLFAQKRQHAEEQGQRCRLGVVAFGGNIKGAYVTGVEDMVRQVVFVPATVVDPFGQSRLTAAEAKVSAVKYFEPQSQILDYAFPTPVRVRSPP